MAKFKILSYQKLEIECIKNRILNILQKHTKKFKIQSPFNSIPFINDAFPVLSYKSCHTFLWVKSRNLIVILFTKNKALDAFVPKQTFSVCYADTFSSTWHMFRENTWWQESLALSIRNRHNCVSSYRKM